MSDASLHVDMEESDEQRASEKSQANLNFQFGKESVESATSL